MGKLSRFFLVMAAMACLMVSGCGGDNNDNSYLLLYRPSGNFVYVNNDATVANYVSAFAIQADGTLAELANSPYLTGGIGSDGGYYASQSIALAPWNALLFAANKNDNTITVFRVDIFSGALTQIGLPVNCGGTMGSGGSMVVNSAESLLFVANDTSNSISVFSIGADGTLTAITGSPFAIGTTCDGITLNSVGSFLYVAAPTSNELVVLSVAADGTLTPITGSPFAYTGAGGITSFTLATTTLGIAGAVGGEISSYTIDATGAPTLASLLAIGGNSQCITTTRSGSLAILAGGDTATISVLDVAADGTMTAVAGSPFATLAGSTGYAVPTPQGTFLYATENNQVEALSIAADGALTSLGAFAITNPGYATGILVY